MRYTIKHPDMSQNLEFPRLSPRREGMDTPYFIAEISAFGPATVLRMTDGSLLHLNQRVDRLDLKWVHERDLAGAYRLDMKISCRSNDGAFVPANGWQVVEARCDQTGGMTMVDVIVFRNGLALTVTDECAELHANVARWDDIHESDDDAGQVAFIMHPGCAS